MKLKIKKENKADIGRIRALIKDSFKYQDKLIDHLAVKFGIEKDSPEYEILWDYIMNDSDWMVEFVK